MKQVKLFSGLNVDDIEKMVNTFLQKLPSNVEIIDMKFNSTERDFDVLIIYRVN